MRIDVHNHYYAEPYIAALVASGRPEVARATMPNDIDDRIALSVTSRGSAGRPSGATGTGRNGSAPRSARWSPPRER